jgi:hypothetical protein
MQWVCIIKEKIIFITIYMTINAHHDNDNVHHDTMMMKQWAPFGPQDEFNVANIAVPAA